MKRLNSLHCKVSRFLLKVCKCIYVFFPCCPQPFHTIRETYKHTDTTSPTYHHTVTDAKLIKRCTRQWTDRQNDIQKKSKNQLCILKVIY